MCLQIEKAKNWKPAISFAIYSFLLEPTSQSV
jgi:hypothetical protein